MLKADTLYTVNKWNKPLFDTSTMTWNNPYQNSLGSPYSFGNTGLTTPTTSYVDWKNPAQTSQLMQKNTQQIQSLGNSNGFGNFETPKDSFFNKKAVQQGLGIGASAAQSIPTGDRRGAFDTLDPLYYLADGKESKLGNAVGDAGVGLFQAGAQSGNGALMLAGAAAKIGGDLINWGWGTKENKKNVSAIKDNTAQAKEAGRALASSGTSSDFFNNAGQMVGNLGFNWKDLYKDGRFTNKGYKKGTKLIKENDRALAMQRSGMVTGAQNVDSTLDDNVMYNFAALGGPLDYMGNNNNMGAIEYNFMSDFLNNKKKQAENKNNMTNMFAGMPTMFADGGKIEIKHPGRLTELKKRTGKTEAELYNDGNPDHKKMVVFARNSRRWNKKALGGYLKGKVYDVPKEEVDKLIAAGYGVEYL